MSIKETEIGELMALFSANPEIPLRFYLEGISINQGYHVTEVKYANVASTDCARRTGALEELTIQLLDGNARSEQGYMSTTKFLSIIRSTLGSLPESSRPYLFFEFSPNNGPLNKLTINSIKCVDGELSIHLNYEKAVCKPIQGWGFVGDAISKVASKGCCSSISACCG